MQEKTKLLLVDDEPANILALQYLLEDIQEAEVFSANSAQEALALLLDHDFGLALLDVRMPETDGFQLAALMRGSQRYRSIPLMFVTAEQPHSATTFSGYESGAVDFLYKPLDPRIVRGKVRTFVALDQQKKELVRLKEAAEVASQAKSRFLATMSHEMRTPLAAVVGYSELLKQPEMEPEDRQQCAEAIARNGAALAKLIDDVLDLSKIESGGLELDMAPVSSDSLLTRLKDTWQLKAVEKELEFRVMSREMPPSFMCDEHKLFQILTNLVGNAFKFTQRGGVTVLASADGSHLRFEVSDTGCGLSQSAISRLFQPFTQADSSTSRKYGGTGLGLVISRDLARALGGDVVIASSRPEQGTTFVVTVTLQAAELEEGSAPVLPQHSLEGFKFLLAEDHEDLGYIVARYLREAGGEVELVGNGLQALAHLQGSACDLVLLDMHMPELDGFETAARLRASGYSSPILALTAAGMEEDRQRCLRMGCSDYVSKPIRRDGLLATIRKHLPARAGGPPPPARSLEQEPSGSRNANCIDQAGGQAQEGDRVYFVRDNRPEGEGVGHVLLGRGERIVDPATETEYPDFQAYCASHPQHSLDGKPDILADCDQQHLQTILEAPSHQERQQAIRSAGLWSIHDFPFAASGAGEWLNLLAGWCDLAPFYHPRRQAMSSG